MGVEEEVRVWKEEMKERRGTEERGWYVKLIVEGGKEGKGLVKLGWERLDGGGELREGEVPCAGRNTTRRGGQGQERGVLGCAWTVVEEEEEEEGESELMLEGG